MFQIYKNWKNAENPASFSLKNVFRVFLSLFRRYLPTPKHIKEQAIWRKTQADKKCIESGVCVCGCDLEGLLYANEPCDKNCYPPMFSKKTWNNFKKIKNIRV